MRDKSNRRDNRLKIGRAAFRKSDAKEDVIGFGKERMNY